MLDIIHHLVYFKYMQDGQCGQHSIYIMNRSLLQIFKFHKLDLICYIERLQVHS
jgi:hypothetical protein